MQFPTLAFAIFFIIVYGIAWALKGSNEWRKIALLMASWFFYGSWNARFVMLLFVSAALNWAVAHLFKKVHNPRLRRSLLVVGVVSNLAVLAYLKYVGFFFEQLSAVLNLWGFGRDVPLLDVLLPVGVSFFTFQAISYIVDVYKEKICPADFLDLALLMSFFPHLVAGPIVRASDLLPQFRQTPRLTRGTASAALLLILWGLFKKAVVASELATNLVDPAFHDPVHRTSFDLLFGAYGYAVQIYCDFSAYSDMAIGLAALLGYVFPRNFDQPYRSSSLQDFWRRWHISLSSWLRDYLYIPLGGNRKGRVRGYCNLFATMFLGGLWHGASWNFMLWGSLHGAWLGMERYAASVRPKSWGFLPKWIGIFVTFHVVVLGWIFFRAASIRDAVVYLKGLAACDLHNTLVTPLSLLLVGFGLSLHAMPARGLQAIVGHVRRWPAPVVGLATAGAILIIDAMRPAGVAPFIYYQF